MEFPVVFDYFLPVAAIAITLEWLWTRRARKASYSGGEVARNGVLWLGYETLTWATGGLFLLLGDWFYDHRLYSFDFTVASFVALLLAEDFIMYATHVAKHKCHFYWAADHEVHHSSTEFNFTTAFRNGWLAPLSGSWLPWTLLCLLGFPPLMVLFQAALSRAYQCFTHTSLVRRLPAPIEWLFVTPSHHRVHHAKNDAYIDKNYGGILIIWDRMFGTFEAERDDEPCEFGILAPIDTTSLWEVSTGALRRMAAKVHHRRGLRAKLGTVLMPPNWEPERRGS